MADQDGSINFNSIENNSRSLEFIDNHVSVRCPRASRWIEVSDGERDCTFPMACKRYDCPVCGPKKIKAVKRRCGQAAEWCLQYWRDMYPGRKDHEWWTKLATFTWAGADQRMQGFGSTGGRSDYTGTKSPQEAYKEMQEGFNAMMSSIRVEFPLMDYLRVSEPQRDGYPHFHVLFIGPDANKPGFLDRLKFFWSKYGFGSFLNMIKITRGAWAGVKYALKYLTKLTMGLSFLPKGHRVLTESHGFRFWFPFRKKSNWFMVRMGRYDSESGYGAELCFSDRAVDIPLPEQWLGDLPSSVLSKNFSDVFDFFGSKTYHVQNGIKWGV